jgi:molybdate transport system substrate-binding protein
MFSCSEGNNKPQGQIELTVFVGSASKPATEEIVRLYEEQTGVRVNASYGGSGYVLSQMALSKMGDVFFPGSPDFMEKASRQSMVYPESISVPVYLVSSINVQLGNPKRINELEDLLRPGLKLAIAAPEHVCVGSYAVEILEQHFDSAQVEMFRENLVTYTESCDKTATAVALKSVDAVIGWRIFQFWNPSHIENVRLKTEEIVRVGYIPIAISKFTKQKELAQNFIDFVMGAEAKEIFEKHHYFTSTDQAFNFVGSPKPVGGEYSLPENWLLD